MSFLNFYFSEFHCISTKNLEIFETAQVAFVKIGELLQDRRKRDFYELVQYHESSNVDPAREDESLKKKLDENHKYYSKRMDDVIDKCVHFDLVIGLDSKKTTFNLCDLIGIPCGNDPAAMMKKNDGTRKMWTKMPARRSVK